jgi:4-hydroxy-2-oxoglutarate aldolase
MQTTEETVACCRAAADAGADAVLVLPPHYFKGQGMPGAAKFFADVAGASPIPVVLYNMPANTGVDMDVETILALAEHPNIIGVKDTSGNMTKLGYLTAGADRIKEKHGRGFSIFCGSGNYFLSALSTGTSGGTLAIANLYPESCRELMRLHRSGTIQRAMELQRLLLIASDAVTARFGVPGLKAAMDRAGLYGGGCRAPLMSLGDEAREKLFCALDLVRELDVREVWRLER